MSRTALAVVLLLLALPAMASPAEAQVVPGYAIPTQQDARVGDLNVTAWIMRDTRTITYTPDLRANPLAYLWNLNFTAGSLGIVYVKAQRLEGNESYDVEYAVRSATSLVQLVPYTSNQTAITAQSGVCTHTEASPGVSRCHMPGNVSTADATFQFFVASAAPPGPAGLSIDVTVARNTTGTPEAQGRKTFPYTLQVIDPLPPFATRATVGGDTTLGAWTNGGPLGATSGGCLGGSAVGRDENITNGVPAVICLIAVTRSQDMLRVTGSLRGESWLIAPPEGWTSEPFNQTSGGVSAPVHGFAFQTNGQAPLGAHQATLHYKLERQGNGTWATVQEGDLLVPFSVAVAPIVVRGPASLNWIAHAPLLLASVAGLGYMAYASRKPKFQSRSQALKAEQVSRTVKDEGAAAEVVAEQQRQEVQEAAWSKKRAVLEAKREDILKSIRIAEERHQRGEITEHVLKGIRERKERQLEAVQKEMEEQGAE